MLSLQWQKNPHVTHIFFSCDRLCTWLMNFSVFQCLLKRASLQPLLSSWVFPLPGVSNAFVCIFVLLLFFLIVFDLPMRFLMNSFTDFCTWHFFPVSCVLGPASGWTAPSHLVSQHLQSRNFSHAVARNWKCYFAKFLCQLCMMLHTCSIFCFCLYFSFSCC